MGANHHIHLTTQISMTITTKYIKDEDLKLLLPKAYREDFDLVYTKDYMEENMVYPNGVEKKFLLFSLKKKYLKDVQSFIVDSLLMAQESLNHGDVEHYDKFIEWFKELNIDVELLYQVHDKKIEEFADRLKEMEYNFFTTYTEIPSYVVYEGFPRDLKEYNMIGFDIVYSYFKFLTNIEGTFNFEQLKRRIQKESKYPILSKYIYHMGY